jgi:hypothetical protein
VSRVSWGVLLFGWRLFRRGIRRTFRFSILFCRFLLPLLHHPEVGIPKLPAGIYSYPQFLESWKRVNFHRSDLLVWCPCERSGLAGISYNHNIINKVPRSKLSRFRLDFRFAQAGYYYETSILKRRKRRGIRPELRNKINSSKSSSADRFRIGYDCLLVRSTFIWKM